ncbi:MAG: hypothetical protein WCL02_03940 [bacterium]
MRFSFSGDDDIVDQPWLPFANATGVLLPINSAGKKYLYAQYGYDTGTVATVMDDVDVATLNE